MYALHAGREASPPSSASPMRTARAVRVLAIAYNKRLVWGQKEGESALSRKKTVEYEPKEEEARQERRGRGTVAYKTNMCSIV